MSVPLYIHLAGSQGRQDDQRIGSAFIWLDDGQLRIRKIQLEESEDNASVSEQTRQQLMALANAPFNEALTIPLTDNAQLDLSLRQLLLQLVVGFAPIFPDICYHLTHYKPAAADIPVASDNPAHYADAIRYNARTPLQGSLLPLTRLVWA
ncbi:putative fimbrial outer membrane usher protein [Escherichia coli]|nr:putative fimbrial outer membrane usher protein [Escherichia coli]